MFELPLSREILAPRNLALRSRLWVAVIPGHTFVLPSSVFYESPIPISHVDIKLYIYQAPAHNPFSPFKEGRKLLDAGLPRGDPSHMGERSTRRSEAVTRQGWIGAPFGSRSCCRWVELLETLYGSVLPSYGVHPRREGPQFSLASPFVGRIDLAISRPVRPIVRSSANSSL